MNSMKKEARKRLREATRTEFEYLIYGAMLTKEQEKIIRLHIADGLPVCSIAMQMNYSDALVRKRLSEAYRKIAKV